MMLELKQEKEAQQTKTRELESIVDDSILAWPGKIAANMSATVSTIADNCVALSKAFAKLSDAIADTNRTQHAVDAIFDTSLTRLAEQLQKHDAQVMKTSDGMDHYEKLFQKLEDHIPRVSQFAEAGTSIATNMANVHEKMESIERSLLQKIENLDTTMLDISSHLGMRSYLPWE
jgi:hypothetical protein